MQVDTGYMYLRHLYDEILSGKVIVPEYQREYCWDNAKIELFIDSLLNDIPIGVFQFRKTKNNLEVVDGLHRIRTLFRILKGDGIYFNFEKNTFTINPNDFDYAPFVFKNGELSQINILGDIKTPGVIPLSQKFSPFYEKVYHTQLLKYVFSGTDEQVRIAFDRINEQGVQFTPTFVQVSNSSTLSI